MAEQIYLITDYKNFFGSKYITNPYRSGFDKNLLIKLFYDCGYIVKFINPSVDGIDFKNLEHKVVLYTSQEDYGLFYKSFLEDIVLTLEFLGAIVIPSFKLLHAHENKVFFEMIRKSTGLSLINIPRSQWFGTFEDFKSNIGNIKYPLVVKSSSGSMSRGVSLAKSKKEGEKLIKKISRTNNSFLRLWDKIRYLKHDGYIPESWNRRKFIVQEYIPGLVNDFKVLVFGNKYYVLKRGNKKGDFRASGQGNLSFIRDVPEGLLNYSEECFKFFNCPQASFDIGFDGNKFYLFEAQFVYFGTYTIEYSEFYFKKESGFWIVKEGKSILEIEYVQSIVEFLSY